MKNLINNLRAIVGSTNVLSEPDELLVYECDGLPQHKYRPGAVVFPASTEETSLVMKELARAGVPFTPRGAGTGLSGGALALESGVVVELARMRKLLAIDVENRLAIVQPGVVNLQVSKAAAPFGLYYVPDPSSQPTCTIGGNIAESAGGIHCLKYGTTTDHVLACRVVLSGGEVVDLGGAGIDAPGLDLLGTFIGSEGTFGIVTEATLRLVQVPPAVRTLLAEFAEVNDASHAVSAIIAAGVMPAALEMMDHEIIRAVEASVFAAGLPPDAGAALLIELDGIEAGIDEEAEHVTAICMEYGARNCRRARDDAERKKLWAARKGAFGAVGRISPDSMIQDAVVPRSRLPEVLSRAYEIAKKYNLRIANVFHAGDGNLHPLICFDSRFPEEVKRVKEAGRELMEVCVANGGTITGEHGVGLDKRELLPLVFSDADMEAMLKVRAAFDPTGLLNPGKIIPFLRGCGEGRAVAIGGDNGAREITPPLLPTSGLASPTRPTPLSVDDAALQLSKFVDDVSVSLSGEVVVIPHDARVVAEVMKFAIREGLKVSVSGGTPRSVSTRRPSIFVSTKRLNKILEHEPADLIAVAQPGVTLVDFNAELTRNGQWLPLDPPDDGHATLGGVVATGVGGPQQFAYGRPRGSVIGMRVVLADGTEIKAGGRVVKNVAGYDLCKLFTGSRGLLGIITELNFKLRPRPVQETTLIAGGRRKDLAALARLVIQSALFPVAVELLSPGFASAIQVNNRKHHALLVRFAGTEKGVVYQTAETLRLADEVVESSVLANDEVLWRGLSALSSQSGTGWRASMRPGNIERFLTAMEVAIGPQFETERWQLGLADGRFRLLGNDAPAAPESLSLSRKLATVARESGATVLIESRDGRDRDLSEVLSPGVAQLTNRIKEQLDPRGTFVPINA